MRVEQKEVDQCHDRGDFVQHRIGHDANYLRYIIRVIRRHQEERHQCGDNGVQGQAALEPGWRLDALEQGGSACPQHHDAQHKAGLKREIHPILRFRPCFVRAHKAQSGNRQTP